MKGLRDALRVALLRPKADGRRAIDVIADRLVVAAEAGESWAIEELANRLDGHVHSCAPVAKDRRFERLRRK